MTRRKETTLTDYKSLKAQYELIEYTIDRIRKSQIEQNRACDKAIKKYERELEAIRFTGTYKLVIESNIK